MHILVTGAAGFIGFHLAQRFLKDGHSVVGLDNLNDYYSIQLKRDRLDKLWPQTGFRFVQLDLADSKALLALFEQEKFTHVVNLAAQAGVRYSLLNPEAYIQSNLVGFANLLEACRNYRPEHLIFASSSSIYGLNSKMPFKEEDGANHPASLYAATKKSGELLAHSYSHLYRIPSTGLRFFTVYGPWGRPDMAIFSFTENILAGKAVDIFNHGKMQRDFTYIDDIVEGVVKCTSRPAAPTANWDSSAPNPASSSAPYRLYNIGNNQPVELEHFVEILEKALNKKAVRNYLPMQAGDVYATYADIDNLHEAVGFTPSTPLEQGIKNFVEWYKTYHKII